MTIAVVRVQVPPRVLFQFNLFKLRLTTRITVLGVFCVLDFNNFYLSFYSIPFPLFKIYLCTTLFILGKINQTKVILSNSEFLFPLQMMVLKFFRTISKVKCKVQDWNPANERIRASKKTIDRKPTKRQILLLPFLCYRLIS